MLKTYEDINQEVIKSNPEGYVNISIYRNDDETDETKYEKINSRMLEIIKELQNDDFPLKDILILVEKLSFAEKEGYKVESLKETIKLAKLNEMYLYAYNYIRNKYKNVTA